MTAFNTVRYLKCPLISSKDPLLDQPTALWKIYTSGNVSTFEGCFPNSAESPEKLRLQYPHVSRLGRSSNPGRDKPVVYKIKMVVKTLDSRYEYNGFSEMIPRPSRISPALLV